MKFLGFKAKTIWVNKPLKMKEMWIPIVVNEIIMRHVAVVTPLYMHI